MKNKPPFGGFVLCSDGDDALSRVNVIRVGSRINYEE
nr:MAG TPA: hypothetical protein [Caudoviricetes sp.]